MEENKYKDALERAKSAIKECGDNVGRIKMIESIFPELAWDMDEQSRKWILEYLYDGLRKADEQFEGQFKAAIAYLEKVKNFDEQLEQAYKTADEVQYKRGYGKGYVDGMAAAKKKELEKQAVIKDGNSIDPQFAKPITTTETKYPKFKVGDWVVDEEDNHVYQVKRVVTNVSSGMSGYDLSDGGYFYSTKTNCHLWSIADVKDGDVLAEDSCIFIIQKKLGDYSKAAKTYCALHNDGDFDDGSILYFDIDSTKPATKEQCELLFRKMEENGYAWNPITKELSQISVTKKSDKVWSEEDESKIIDSIYEAINVYYLNYPLVLSQIKDWLKSIKDRIQPQPKQVEWSEEDKEMKDLIDEISCQNDDVDYETHVRITRWLNELKQRL